MNDPHDVISAFLDDEPFDAQQLADALSDPDGRALLIDLLALRHVVQPPADAASSHRRGSRLRAVLAIAAVIVAMVGGFWIGERRSQLASIEAPAPTRVVETGEWQAMP